MVSSTRIVLKYNLFWDLGGNVDITDSDGETPLYTVESVDTARWLVEHGATISRTNHEGVSVGSVLSLFFLIQF